jgi:hypothetical protein
MVLLDVMFEFKDLKATGDLACALAGGHFYRSNA